MEADRVLYTSSDRNMPWFRARTRLPIIAYCQKCRCGRMNLPKNRLSRYWVLFDAMKDSLRREEERPGGIYVWMDADILIDVERAPDLFELPDRLFVCRHDNPGQAAPSWRRHHAKYGVPNPMPYPVTAIVRWSARHALAVVEAMKDQANLRAVAKDLNDQDALAYFCFKSETPFYFMPQLWHAMTPNVSERTLFYHAAGSDKPRKLGKCQRILDRKGKKNASKKKGR